MSSPAILLVKNFLELVAARDLGAASGYLSDDIMMVFPGGNTFNCLTDMVHWSQSQYQDIEKNSWL